MDALKVSEPIAKTLSIVAIGALLAAGAATKSAEVNLSRTQRVSGPKNAGDFVPEETAETTADNAPALELEQEGIEKVEDVIAAARTGPRVSKPFLIRLSNRPYPPTRAMATSIKVQRGPPEETRKCGA